MMEYRKGGYDDSRYSFKPVQKVNHDVSYLNYAQNHSPVFK